MIQETDTLPGSIVTSFEAATPDIRAQLLPLFEDALAIDKAVVNSMNAYGVAENEVLTYLQNPDVLQLTPAKRKEPHWRNVIRFADQYDHVRNVVHTSMELKRTIIESGLNGPIVAYQTGTGWPLPETDDAHCKEVMHIKFGEGALSSYIPPGLEKDEGAGLHIYRVTGNDGKEITLLALKGRIHDYTETSSDTASLDLAFMARVLKGVGTEFILSTFASGVDPYIVGKNKLKQWKTPKLDLAIIADCTDESGLAAFMGPASGDQRLIGPVFGGAFQSIAAMKPNVEDARLFTDTVQKLVNGELLDSDIRPSVHLTIEVDTMLTPNFQNPTSHAHAEVTFHWLKTLGTLKSKLTELFAKDPLLLVHGMAQLPERLGYFQSSPYSIHTLFNRQLRELPVVIFTDYVDPSEKGQSTGISDELVREEGAKAGVVTAKIITAFFRAYADRT